MAKGARASVCMVLSTVSSRKEAERIAKALLKERLAACVSFIPGVSSCFWWKGKQDRATEFLLLMKTTRKASSALMRRVRELHSYETPEILTFGAEAGDAAYVRWLEKSVGRS